MSRNKVVVVEGVVRVITVGIQGAPGVGISQAYVDAGDAASRQRSNHTGTQPSSTISDFNTAADARIEVQKGIASGLATLDSNAKIPTNQLPVVRFGSAEYTHTVVEEVGEVSKKGLDVFTSRKNRFLNKEYGIVGKTVQTCNPTNNFIRQEYYEPYKQLGMGRVQKWEHGRVHLLTDPPGVFVTAYRAFLRSRVSDNPFADPNYIEELRRKPPAERKRLLEGNWDYLDADYMLFTDLILDRALRSTIPAGRKVLGVDIADGGKDSTEATVMEGGIATEIIEIPVDHSSEVDPAEQVALGIIKIATQRSINPQDVGIDGVGA
jgi:hypothetical protein